jgi:DNA primase (bacterial type)
MIDLINGNILRDVKEGKDGQYSAFCPICEADKTKGTHNLYFKYENNKCLINCKKGCSVGSICSTLNINESDLFADSDSHASRQQLHEREHIYADESGHILGKKVIKPKSNGEKSCAWYRYTPDGYVKRLDGLKMPLYHLDKLVNSTSDTIYFVEGEKDVETMERLGFTATTMPNGGGQAKIPEGYIQYFKGKKVIIIHDNDKTGIEFADKIKQTLINHCNSVIVVDPLDISGLARKRRYQRYC